MEIGLVSLFVTVISIVSVTVAITVQAGLTRRKEKERFVDSQEEEKVFVDSQTQTAYTYVRSVYFKWNPPKTVPVARWKLSWGTPEVWRFKTTDNPFHAEPVLIAGQVRPNIGTKDSEEFDRIAALVGGEHNLINGPPANA